MAIAGCGAYAPTGTANRPQSTLDLSTLGLDDAPRFNESDLNDDFESAERVEPGDAPVVIAGELSTSSDVDVFDLGPAAAGDRVVVNIDAVESLKGAAALFDETGAALLVNDHRNVYLGAKGPFVDLVLRRPTEHTYVAFTSTPSYLTSGAYGLTAAILPGNAVPSPRHDTILLDFRGGQGVRIGSRAPIDVPRFNAADIDPSLSADTDALIELVVAMVREDFAPYHVTILSTSEGEQFDGTTSRLVFGSYDPALLGVAEGVDEYNSDTRQSAIVFTETFEAFMSLDPTLEELAQALANVASHEIGHLLGQVHTKDDQAIMDVTASLSALMEDQVFRTSPLYAAVFPLGQQDSVQGLLDAVGGDESLARAVERRYEGKTAARLRARDTGQSARSVRAFSRCGLNERHDH